MQTFLPYSNYAESASVLDNQRLGKQRVEAKQIYLALTEAEYGWKNHPAVKMWKGSEQSLLEYGLAICKEWKDRGFQDTLYDWFSKELSINYSGSISIPPSWLGNKRLHSSHRSALLAKDYEHYSQFGWTEEPISYWWPI